MGRTRDHCGHPPPKHWHKQKWQIFELGRKSEELWSFWDHGLEQGAGPKKTSKQQTFDVIPFAAREGLNANVRLFIFELTWVCHDARPTMFAVLPIPTTPPCIWVTVLVPKRHQSAGLRQPVACRPQPNAHGPDLGAINAVNKTCTPIHILLAIHTVSQEKRPIHNKSAICSRPFG